VLNKTDSDLRIGVTAEGGVRDQVIIGAEKTLAGAPLAAALPLPFLSGPRPEHQNGGDADRVSASRTSTIRHRR